MVNFPAFAYNGVFSVTSPGGVGNAVLTRVTDMAAQYQIFDGVTVPVISGASYSHTNMVLNCPTNYNAANVDGSATLLWSKTTSATFDQYCIMFSSGSYTAIATDSTSYVGTGSY